MTLKHEVSFITTVSHDALYAALERLNPETLHVLSTREIREEFTNLAAMKACLAPQFVQITEPLPKPTLPEIAQTLVASRQERLAQTASKLVYTTHPKFGHKKIDVPASCKAIGLTKAHIMATKWPNRSDCDKIQRAIRMHQKQAKLGHALGNFQPRYSRTPRPSAVPDTAMAHAMKAAGLVE